MGGFNEHFGRMVQQGNQATGFDPAALQGLLLNAAAGADPTMGLLGRHLPQPQQQNIPVQLLAGMISPGVGEFRSMAKLGKGFPSYNNLQNTIDNAEDALVAGGGDILNLPPDVDRLYAMRNAVMSSEDASAFHEIAKRLPFGGPVPDDVLENTAKRLFDRATFAANQARADGKELMTSTDELKSIAEQLYQSFTSSIPRFDFPYSLSDAVEVHKVGAVASGLGQDYVTPVLEQVAGVLKAFGVGSVENIKGLLP